MSESCEQVHQQEEDVVTPWEVASVSDKGVDYDKLISKFKVLDCKNVVIGRLLWLFLRSQKGGCCSISGDLSCS